MRSAAWSLLFAAGTAIAASPDGTCGGSNGYSCWGSFFGNCCGSDGICGSTPDKCGSGCQTKFGFCQELWYQKLEQREGPEYGSFPGGEDDDDEDCDCDDEDESSTPSGPIQTGGSSSYSYSSSLPAYPTGGSSSYSYSYPSGTGSGSTPVGPIGTGPSGHPSGYPSGTGSSSYSYPSGTGSGYPSGTGSGSTPVGPIGTGSSSYSYSYPSGTGSSSYSHSYPSGTGSGSTPVGPIGTGSSSYSHSYPSGTGSGSGYPSGTGSYSIPPFPTGGSSSYPGGPSGSVSGHPSGTGPSGTGPSGTGPHGSGSTPVGPISTGGTTSKPQGTAPSGTAPSGTAPGSVGTTSKSTTCSSIATPTAGFLPNCVPCEGQPNAADKFCGFDASTNSYENTPKTCKVVEYTFEITDETVSPDGISRPAMLVNGEFPGPQLSASWGDTIIVHVTNSLTSLNGSSIHFHGLRQHNNSANDGVPSITQCPIAPGETMTYQFVAENYGTSWYHSHYAIQAWEGVFGPMIIDGPHSDDSFDEDLGPIIVSDWSHFTVDSRYDLAQNATVNPATNQTYGGPVVMDTGLINGKNVWGEDGAANQTGSRSEFNFVAGKKYLLRIINTSIQSTFKFYIDGHSMTVISADFVPIQPYTTNILNINIGQRYNVIIEASQSGGNFWMRSDNQNACAGTVQAKNIKAIVRYSGGADLPTSTGYNYTDECIDEPYDKLVPFSSLDAAAADTDLLGGPGNVVVAANSASLFKWYISDTTFFSEYDDPTLLDIEKNGSTPDYSGNLLIKVPDANQMVYVIIETPIPLPHPIHLHGHDFWILAEGSGTYSSNTTLNLSNPPRRDVALMPAAGFIVLAFVTDNPGVWLMHCHIGWHTSMGFALQIVEQQDKIKKTVKDTCKLENNCKSWDTWSTANGVKVVDSGV